MRDGGERVVRGGRVGVLEEDEMVGQSQLV